MSDCLCSHSGLTTHWPMTLEQRALAFCTSESSGIKWRKQEHLPRGALWRKVSGGNKFSKGQLSSLQQLLQHQHSSQTILIPMFFKQKPKKLYFLQIPPFLVTINTLNRESNLSSFSFRDIFLLSASESFRVTSLETASSLFCATLKGKEKEFPHAPGVNSALSETLCTPSLSWQLYHALHFKKTSWTESSKLITLY